MTSFIYSNNSLSKSSTNLATSTTNTEQQKEEQDYNNNVLASNSSSLLTTSSLSSSLSTNANNNDDNNNNNINNNDNSYSPYPDNSSDSNQPQISNAKILKKSLSISSDNTTYMNFVLAQIGVYFIYYFKKKRNLFC